MLQIPNLVSLPRIWEDENKVKSTCIDVMFNPEITDRCWKPEGTPGLNAEYYRLALGDLAKRMVEQEETNNLTLSKNRWTVFKRAKYKGGDAENDNAPVRFDLPEDCWMDQPPPPTSAADIPNRMPPPMMQEVDSPAEAKVKEEAAAAKKKKKPKEKNVGAGINKKNMNAGFFGKAGKKGTVGDKANLYPNGSNEGYDPENPGQLRDGQGDPMGWMPKKLRGMVQVADTSTMNEMKQKEMMENYVDTGKRMPGDPVDAKQMQRKMKEAEDQAKAEKKVKEYEVIKLKREQEASAAGGF